MFIIILINISRLMDERENYARDRQIKQDFLKDNIVDKGYNTGEFAHFLLEQRENGTEIDVWVFSELQVAVNDFQSRYHWN